MLEEARAYMVEEAGAYANLSCTIAYFFVIQSNMVEEARALMQGARRCVQGGIGTWISINKTP